MRLPINQYQILTPLMKVDSTVDTDGSPTDCVAFRARNAQLLIELSWTSPDDLDLEVVQPDGQMISRKNKRSTQNGVFFMDANRKTCDLNFPVGKEIVRYRPNADVIPGEYVVRVRHFENCRMMATAWNLRVSVNGIQILVRKGTSRRNNRNTIGVFTFSI